MFPIQEVLVIERENPAAAAIVAAAANWVFEISGGVEGSEAVTLCRSWIAARNSGW